MCVTRGVIVVNDVNQIAILTRWLGIWFSVMAIEYVQSNSNRNVINVTVATPAIERWQIPMPLWPQCQNQNVNKETKRNCDDVPGHGTASPKSIQNGLSKLSERIVFVTQMDTLRHVQRKCFYALMTLVWFMFAHKARNLCIWNCCCHYVCVVRCIRYFFPTLLVKSEKWTQWTAWIVGCSTLSIS